MRNRLVFGRYIDTGSWVHQLDPRSKITSMLFFMAAVFTIDSYYGVLAVLVFSLLLLWNTKIPFSTFLKSIKPLTFIILFIFLFHLLFEAGGKPFIDLGVFTLYAGGLERGMMAASRMMLFIVFAAMLSFTTQPERMTQGLGSLLKPLKYIGGKPDRLSLMVGISIRFIPTVFEEAERVWKAQISRGLDLREGSIRKRAALILALLVPVTSGAFRRAIDLADSMEARGYKLDAPRTAYRRLSWDMRDTLYLVAFLLPLAAVILL